MKKAITYYHDVMRDSYSGIKFHDTGKQAVETILKDQKKVFNLPSVQKGTLNLTRKNQVTIGFPFRKLVARFLDETEISIIKKIGLENIWFDYEKGKVINNPDFNKNNNHDIEGFE